MCGIAALLLARKDENVNQLLFDALTILQHRGQDAAGIVTCHENRLHLRKGSGYVKDVFHTNDMIDLVGHMGLGHCRYPTAGNNSSCAEAQPFYTNFPYGICLAHNGNLVNAERLRDHVSDEFRHVNTDSDSELILNLFAEELRRRRRNQLDPEDICESAGSVIRRCDGGFAVAVLINGVGLVAFRDPHGIRPLTIGTREIDGLTDYVFASESAAIDTLGFDFIRDVAPGEAIFVSVDGQFYSQMCVPQAKLSPCLFEYVYFARPDSVIDGVSVYASRLFMGEKLARKIQRLHPDSNIDVVMPIPDTSRTSALQLACTMNVNYREGFIKNRYIARTFIMPEQQTRKKSVRLKLNSIKTEFAGKNVLLVDDSIVRGTTSSELVSMARDAGANKVFFASAAPAVRYPNVYGIDIPTKTELIANNRDEEEIASILGADWVVYQDLEDLEDAVRMANPEMKIEEFESSCFSGVYVTENVTEDYLERLYYGRGASAPKISPNTDGNSPAKLPHSYSGPLKLVSSSSRLNDSGGPNTPSGQDSVQSDPALSLDRIKLKLERQSSSFCEPLQNLDGASAVGKTPQSVGLP
mmetsp:Transcript_16194/g.21452  ORF Transcript_16194/g.21452 Transcript_16194/m.21452 type:complete len:583 (-) Transcript_16194:240-1988(-)